MGVRLVLCRCVCVLSAEEMVLRTVVLLSCCVCVTVVSHICVCCVVGDLALAFAFPISGLVVQFFRFSDHTTLVVGMSFLF